MSAAMNGILGMDIEKALRQLTGRRDAALLAAVAEGYKLLLVARWSGEEIPAELEIAAQVEAIVAAVPARLPADVDAIRQVVQDGFASMEETYGNVA